jgi:hypothetical protein
VNRHGVVVSELGSEFSVTYRREGSVLVADDLMRKTDPSAEQMVFLVQAWKAAFGEGAVARLALLKAQVVAGRLVY